MGFAMLLNDPERILAQPITFCWAHCYLYDSFTRYLVYSTSVFYTSSQGIFAMVAWKFASTTGCPFSISYSHDILIG